MNSISSRTTSGSIPSSYISEHLADMIDLINHELGEPVITRTQQIEKTIEHLDESLINLLVEFNKLQSLYAVAMSDYINMAITLDQSNKALETVNAKLDYIAGNITISDSDFDSAVTRLFTDLNAKPYVKMTDPSQAGLSVEAPETELKNALLEFFVDLTIIKMS